MVNEHNYGYQPVISYNNGCLIAMVDSVLGSTEKGTLWPKTQSNCRCDTNLHIMSSIYSYFITTMAVYIVSYIYIYLLWLVGYIYIYICYIYSYIYIQNYIPNVFQEPIFQGAKVHPFLRPLLGLAHLLGSAPVQSR